MKKCAADGCNARTMSQLFCERHRARDNYRKPPTEEEKAIRNERARAKKARRRATAGTLSGWTFP